tara:strand:+ start:243 stop:1205 length:963 start_codon:yes stop_codon:yes gene_type:complete
MMIDYYGGNLLGAPGNLGGVDPNAAVSFNAYRSPQGGRMSVTGQGATPAVGAQDVVINSGGNLNNAGVMERARAMTNRGRNIMDGMHTRLANNMQRSSLFPRSALLGGALASGGIAAGIQDLQEGNAVGGITTLATTAAGAGLANKVVNASSRLSGNPYMKLGALAVGGLISGGLAQGAGNIAEDVVGGITGKGSSEGAARKKTEKDVRQQAKNIEILGNAQMQPYVQAQLQLSEAAMNQRLTEFQRQIPLINQMKNADLVRQQSLNASNARNFMSMGVVATAGRLAEGAQAQAGENLRTALTANPYANSTLQAPNISFG